MRGLAPARGRVVDDVCVENRPELTPSADMRGARRVLFVLIETPRPFASCEQVPEDPLVTGFDGLQARTCIYFKMLWRRQRRPVPPLAMP